MIYAVLRNFFRKFFQYCSFSRIEYCEMVFCVQVHIDVVHDVELHVLTLLCLLWGEVSHPGSQTACKYQAIYSF